MVFQPSVNEQLTIDRIVFRVAEHPAAPRMPYGQEGRQATVYQLVAGEDRRALKVFKPRFRVPSLVSLADHLSAFAELAGLSVCRRAVLTPQQDETLLRQYPDLTYCVLMAWVEGPTWTEVVFERRLLAPEQSLALAHSLTEILSRMEQRGIAHCDLSGPNLLLPALTQSSKSDPSSFLALVDVEQLYAPGLEKPAILPGGSPGYAHKTAPEGLWSANADRFAGMVLVAEMLGLCEERVRSAVWGENYFDPGEMQKDSVRYNTLLTALRERWGEAVAGMLARAWHSEKLADCPTFGELLTVLPESHGISIFHEPIDAQPDITQKLMSQAQQLENQGDLAGAITSYRAAMARLAEKHPLRFELPLIISNLEKQQQVQAEILRTVHEAEQFARDGKWEEASKAYQAALAQAPGSPETPSWRTALKRCDEEAQLARSFDGGVEALQRKEWMAARELLGDVVRRRPAYERNGQRASSLLEKAHHEPQRGNRIVWALIGFAGLIALCALISVGGFIMQSVNAQNQTATAFAAQQTNAASAAQQNTASAQQTGTAASGQQTSAAVRAQQTQVAVNSTQTASAFSSQQTMTAGYAQQTQSAFAFSLQQTQAAINAQSTAAAINAQQTAYAQQQAFNAQQTAAAISAQQTAAAQVIVPAPPPAASYVRLVNQLSGKCLTVDSDFTHIIQLSCGGGDNQLWTAPNGGPLKSKTGPCITFEQGHSELLQTSNCSGSPSWGIGPWNGAFHEIVTTGNDCMDVDSRSRADGAHILRFPCSGDGNQLWQ